MLIGAGWVGTLLKFCGTEVMRNGNVPVVARVLKSAYAVLTPICGPVVFGAALLPKLMLLPTDPMVTGPPFPDWTPNITFGSSMT